MYPTTIDTLDDLYRAANTVATLVVQAFGPTDTSIVIGSANGLQPTNGVVSIGNEVVLYSAVNTGGTNPVLVGCSRGYDGTTAAAHAAGEAVELRFVAAHHNRLAQAINAVEGAVGAAPAGDLNGVSNADLVERLGRTLPLVIPKTSTADWSVTHDRRRVVGVQCWRDNGSGTYILVTPTVLNQTISLSGPSTVTIQFAGASTGVVVLT